MFACGEDKDENLLLECHDDVHDAIAWCQDVAYIQGIQPELIPCSDDYASGETGGDTGETGGDTGETGQDSAGDSWDPGAYVHYDPHTNIYEVDAIFIDDLMAANLAPLGNDGARLTSTASGYLQLINVAPGDLAAELGLLSGDVLTSVNGYDLGGLEGRFDAYQALRHEAGFRLTIARGAEVHHLSYELVE